MKWAERLERAALVGWFAKDDKELARSIRTCAVGEATGGMYWRLASYLMTPAEETGLDFTAAVHNDDIPTAIALYHWIETEVAAELERGL